MIVNSGKLKLLGLQLAGLAGYYFGLYTTSVTISPATVWADLVQAAWTGYAPVACGTLATPTIVADKAVTNPTVVPAFLNGSAGSVTYYGWFMIDSVGAPTLIAATPTGLRTILAGASEPLPGLVGLNQL